MIDLNYYIILENSGVSQCNEAQKELCNGKTSSAKKSDFRTFVARYKRIRRGELPSNGRTFVVRYKRIRRGELPPNIVMRRTYTQRAAPRGRRRRRRAQQGQGIFDFVKKVARNPLVRSIAKKGLEYAPGVYQNLTKRVNNKTLKRILNSDTAHLALNKATKTANNRLR